MDITDLLSNVDKNDIFFISYIAIFILFFFTSVVKIEISHLSAILVIIGIFIVKTVVKKENSEDFNTVLEYRLNSLSDIPPDFLYMDADIINIFFNIKQDFFEYNKDTYYKALKCADIVLEIRHDMEEKLCASPEVPNLLSNWSSKDSTKYPSEFQILSNLVGSEDYDLKDDTECKSTLENAYENYQVAEEHVKKCVNYIHSYIINIPSNPVIHRKHQKIVSRLHILLKRNLDIIKDIYYSRGINGKKGINHATKFIDDYDLPKAANKFSDNMFSFY
jgi:hypothetical protein